MKRWFWLLSLLPSVLAFGPDQALRITPPGFSDVVAALELGAWEQRAAWAGLSGSAGVNHAFGGATSYDLRINLSLDPLKRTSTSLDELRREAKLRAEVRAAIYEALVTHARLWRSQAALSAAQLGVERARLSLEAARLRKLGPLTLEDRDLALREAVVKLDLAQSELRAAQARASSLGLVGAAEPGTLHFRIDNEGEKALRFRLENTMASESAAAAWRHLAVLEFSASYSGDPSLSINLTTANLGVGFDLKNMPELAAAPTGWTYSLGARVVLDPTAWLEAARQNHEAGYTIIKNRVEEAKIAAQTDELRARVEAAWKRIELSRRRSELARLRLQQTRLRAGNGLVPKLDLEAARINAINAEVRVAEAWEAYVDAVKAYLDAVDGEWSVQ